MGYNRPMQFTITYPGVPIHDAASPADAAQAQEAKYRAARHIPDPVLVAGKPLDQWTDQKQRDYLHWQLGPRFRAGLKPPPIPEYYVRARAGICKRRAEQLAGNGGRAVSRTVQIRVIAPLVRIKDQRGYLREFRQGGTMPNEFTHDLVPILHHLRHRLIDEKGQPADPGRVWECFSALTAVGVPEDAGRPRAADALREAGFHFSNETISKALALFKRDVVYGDPIDNLSS